MDRPAVVAVVLVMLAIADIARAHDYIKQLSGHVELSEEQLREEFAKVKLSPKELDALEDFLPRLSFQVVSAAGLRIVLRRAWYSESSSPVPWLKHRAKLKW